MVKKENAVTHHFKMNRHLSKKTQHPPPKKTA